MAGWNGRSRRQPVSASVETTVQKYENNPYRQKVFFVSVIGNVLPGGYRCVAHCVG